MRPFPTWATLTLGPLIACSGVRVGTRGSTVRGESDVRAAVVLSAKHLLGEHRITLSGRTLPADCWSLPVAAYAHSGLSLGGGNALGLYRAASDVGRLYRNRPPRPGDSVFTLAAAPARRAAATARARGASAAGSGRPFPASPADPVDFHVGLVGAVDDDGTVLVYQRMARGVVTYRMNAAHPDLAVSPETRRPWNDRIAAGRGETRLAGQLFAAYAAFLP